MTEYVIMMGVVVGGVLAIGALFKTAIPQVFGAIIGGVAIQTDSSEGSTQKAQEAGGGESSGGDWHIAFGMGGKMHMAEGAPVGNSAITQLADVGGAFRVLPKEPGVNRKSMGTEWQ